jgi:hypothetical protein
MTRQNRLSTVAALEAPASEPSTPASNGEANGRTPKGTFAKGNAFGKGHSFNRRLAAARQALTDTVSHDDLARLFRKMFEDAMGGCAASRQLVLAYCVGRPGKVISPDDVEAAELRQFLDFPDVLAIVRGGGRVSPALALEILADSLATDREGYARAWAATVARMQDELNELREQRARLEGRSLAEAEDDEDDDGGEDDTP